jgi:Bacterial archaeo-eukaryotic release factor family 2
MEQRGTTVMPLTDLDDLRALVARPGPFLSAYLAFQPATEDLAHEINLRWQSQRRQVAAAGADEDRLAVVDGVLGGAHRAGAGLAVVAPRSGDLLVERLVTAPFEGAAWGPVPALRPLIALRQRHVAHVVALVDRTGADLRAWRDGEVAADVLETTVSGDDAPVRKVAPGGWSQRRFQQRAEDSWLHNMGQVAAEVAALTDRVRARVVAIGGDERAVGLLVDALPSAVRERVHRIPVTRAADGSGSRLDEEMTTELDRWAADRVRAVLALHAEESGQADRAAGGAGRTLEALREARVAVLLVIEGGPTDDQRDVWVGATAAQVATSPGELTTLDDTRTAPLLDAAVAAALASGADVVVVPRGDDGVLPSTLRDGLGALLRW